MITLSGNSERFKRKNLGHKALCMVERETMVSHFVKSFSDFQDYESVFVCRDQDLKETALRDEITRCAKGAAVYGIEKNDLGPVYSISKIFDRLPDTEPILVSYVDTLQNTSLAQIELDFKNFEGGLSVHDFNNPHWRTNQSYCLVRHDEDMRVKEIIEKFDFSDFDFGEVGGAGSSGNYYFSSGSLMKNEFNKLLQNRYSVNGEYYVTQALGEIVKNKAAVKCSYYPYVALGVPEDLADYEFWIKWFKNKKHENR
jgi:bifunctional N-acetylglucosamine-1-phosphate-uridyltransferase/glucosamine-1-phosphate-acetyltransferase GlmU-like protein